MTFCRFKIRHPDGRISTSELPATWGCGTGAGRADLPLRAREARRPDPHRHQKTGSFRPGRRITGDRTRQSSRRGIRQGKTWGAGWEFVHVAIDDNSRIAFAKVMPNETKRAAAAFLRAAVAYYANLGVKIQRVMSDNASSRLPCANGPMRGPIKAQISDARSCPTGCIPTIGIALMPASMIKSQSAASALSEDNSPPPCRKSTALPTRLSSAARTKRIRRTAQPFRLLRPREWVVHRGVCARFECDRGS